MRELTFPGFLKQYVSAVSLSGTSSIYKLSDEAVSANPRLREPLLLYALCTGKETLLLNAVKSKELREEYKEIIKSSDINQLNVDIGQTSQYKNTALPDRYSRVYKSYLTVKNKNNNEIFTKSLMRDRMIRLQKEKSISNYRIYTDLGLNHGNINAYLKNNNCSKVSVGTARKMLEYLEQAR